MAGVEVAGLEVAGVEVVGVEATNAEVFVPDLIDGTSHGEATTASESTPCALPETPSSNPPQSPLTLVHVGGGPVVIAKLEVIRVSVSELDAIRRASASPAATSSIAAPADNRSTRTSTEDLEPSGTVSPPAPSLPAPQIAPQAAPRGLTVDCDPKDRSGDRALARLGLLHDALPMFAPTERLPRAGVLAVVPLLRAHGLLDAFEQVVSFPQACKIFSVFLLFEPC